MSILVPIEDKKPFDSWKVEELKGVLLAQARCLDLIIRLGTLTASNVNRVINIETELRTKQKEFIEREEELRTMAEELNELKKLKLSVSQTDGINNNSQTGNHESKLSPPSGGSSSKNSTESSTETHNNYTPAFLGDLRYPSVKKREIELKNVPKFYGNINDDVDAWIFVIESQAANLGIKEADLPMAVIPFLRGSALSTIKNMIMKNKN
ncbi:hypothetical protein BpHYR1_030041, partial [Brachionus plicatilis]